MILVFPVQPISLMLNLLDKYLAKILIIGVGNPYRCDDGIGPAIIETLRIKPDASFVVVDGGTDGLALLDLIGEYDRAIIIDAVQMLESPGTVKLFTLAEAKIKVTSDGLSTHGFGLAQMLQLVERLGIKTTIKIIGIQPKHLGFGEHLSAEVQQQIPEILHLIEQEKLCATQSQPK